MPLDEICEQITSKWFGTTYLALLSKKAKIFLKSHHLHVVKVFIITV